MKDKFKWKVHVAGNTSASRFSPTPIENVELTVRGFILTPMRHSQARGGVRWTRFET
jgi:hypothetical protein